MATASAAPNVMKIKMSELEKIKKLGSGAFGAVYEMTWKRPQGSMQVAAKMLSDPDFHELNILSNLDHPSIVKLFGYVDEGITFLLVLELCEGGSLREYLDQHGGLSANLDLFLDWAKQVSIPIKYLRGKQIVHKDLKTPNYLITQSKRLKLADFGLAKNIAHTISNATQRASYPWMAPELFTMGKLSPNYDIFALGIVIWELWTGQFPFKGLEFQVIAWRVCQLKQRPLIPVDMPKPIADLLTQCWDEDWHKRPSIMQIISVIAEVNQSQMMNPFNPGSIPPGMPMQQTQGGPMIMQQGYQFQQASFGSNGEPQTLQSFNSQQRHMVMPPNFQQGSQASNFGMQPALFAAGDQPGYPYNQNAMALPSSGNNSQVQGYNRQHDLPPQYPSHEAPGGSLTG